jgi:glycosyltransferase involved in cell wall biosynthesis
MNNKCIPLISIIVVVLNGSDSIQRTIESIVNQMTYEVEFIVIDGASIDGTLEIIKKYSERFSYWVSEPDQGIYDAWNKGVAASKGKYIAFVGADDIVEFGMLARCLCFIKSNKEYDYISYKAILDTHRPRIFGKQWAWHTFRRYMTVSHVGSLHNRGLYEKYGNYDTSYKIVGDYEFLLRIGDNLKAGFIDYVGATVGANGVSNKIA